MSLESTLAAGRRAAEARMTSRATVRRPTGSYVTGPDGYEVPEWVDVLTDSPFRLSRSTGASRSRTQDVAGVEFETLTAVANFPHDTEGLRDGDFIEVTAGDSAGQVLRIIEADIADQQTAVRVPVEGAQRPAEWGA